MASFSLSNSIKKGELNVTKFEEKGKKIKKNWLLAYVVLTETSLLVYKENANYFARLNYKPQRDPDMKIDLNNATLDWTSPESSKRKYVFEVSTSLGTTILLQNDDLDLAGEWVQAIGRAIRALK